MPSLKRIHVAHLNRTVTLGGRKRPVSRGYSIKAKHILHANLPAPPDSTSFHASATAALKTMLLNDQLGDCVCAGRGHRIGLLTGAANPGHPFVYTDAMTLKDYERIGGYNPSDPNSDQGCDMEVAANDGVSHGYADGSHDLGWISVDATNALEVMQMFYLFENLDIGIELPDAYVNPFPSGDEFVWDVAGDPVPENGHDFVGCDYDKHKGVRIVTWSMEGWITFAALAKYGAASANGEIIVHINADQLAKGMSKAPNGVDWNKLIAFFDEAGGHVPVPAPPAPSPTPTPTPPPSGPITLAQAQAGARAGILRGPRLMSHAQAARASDGGLASVWPKP